MFPNGWPGRSLLLLRLIAGAILIHDGTSAQPRATEVEGLILEFLALLGAALFIIGLWSPLVSAFLAFVELAFAFSKPGHVENSILMGVIAFAIAGLGPGFPSVDAKLYGRKLIVIPDE